MRTTADRERTVDVRVLVAVRRFDADLGVESRGIDVEEHDVVASAVDGVGDGLHLMVERAVDEPDVLQ